MLRANGLLATILFTALTGVVALQVVNRLVLHEAFIWSEEAARFLFFWTVLLGAAMSVRRRRHFVVDVTPASWRHASGPLRVLLDLVPQACVCGFALFLLIPSIEYARAGLLRTASNSGVNMALVYGAIPVFAVLTVVYSLLNLTADYRTWRDGRPLERRPPPAE